MNYIEIPGVKTALSQMVLGAEYFYDSDDVFRQALLDQWVDRGGNASLGVYPHSPRRDHR